MIKTKSSGLAVEGSKSKVQLDRKSFDTISKPPSKTSVLTNMIQMAQDVGTFAARTMNN